MSAPEHSTPTEEHQRMVDSLAKYMRDTLKLNLEGVEYNNYPQRSREIGGKVPDVLAYDPVQQLYSLGEAKTCGDIATDHTKEQLTAWSNVTMDGGKSNGSHLPIYVVTPKNCLNGLTNALAQWDLSNRVTGLTYG